MSRYQRRTEVMVDSEALVLSDSSDVLRNWHPADGKRMFMTLSP